MTSHSNFPAGGQHHGKSGRPHHGGSGVKSGHNAGTAGLRTIIGSVDQAGPLAMQAIAPVQPRLLDLPGTAAYLGVSEWTIRDLEGAGVLPRVRLPLPNGKELRKVLFDVHDLDRLIDTWKEERTLA